MPLPPGELSDAPPTRPPRLGLPWWLGPAPHRQPALSGYCTVLAASFYIFSFCLLNTSVKQNLGCKAGSRIISILQMRSLRLREVQSLAQGDTAGGSVASKPTPFPLPRCLMRGFEKAADRSPLLKPLNPVPTRACHQEAHTYTSLLRRYLAPLSVKRLGPLLCLVAFLSSAWPVVI